MSRELDRLLGPEGPEVTCEECFERLDEYVDAEVAGRDPERAVPGMAAPRARADWWGSHAPIDLAWVESNLPCRAACPVGTHAGGYVSLIAQGRLREA